MIAMHRSSRRCWGLYLRDAGAMFGHSLTIISISLSTQVSRGLTCMLPTEQTARASQRLAERLHELS